MGKWEGDGKEWNIGQGVSSPYAAWDEHFKSKKEVVELKQGDHSTSVVMRETHDYYQLLERGWNTNEIIYYFDESNKINGMLIHAVGKHLPGKTEEFLAWAKVHDPEELEVLIPSGELDPTGDHPQRFRKF